ncbi:MAG: hypothetical protein Q8Q01_03700 [archaeon]|nr:hypothetical protein [archaeon]
MNVEDVVGKEYPLFTEEYEDDILSDKENPHYLTIPRIITAFGAGVFPVLTLINTFYVIKNPSADDVIQAATIGSLSALGAVSCLIYSLFPEPLKRYKSRP